MFWFASRIRSKGQWGTIFRVSKPPMTKPIRISYPRWGFMKRWCAQDSAVLGDYESCYQFINTHPDSVLATSTAWAEQLDAYFMIYLKSTDISIRIGDGGWNPPGKILRVWYVLCCFDESSGLRLRSISVIISIFLLHPPASYSRIQNMPFHVSFHVWDIIIALISIIHPSDWDTELFSLPLHPDLTSPFIHLLYHHPCLRQRST